MKQKNKKLERKCKICGEEDFNLLDTHRITFGSQGGKYKKGNVVCLCCKCHRKVHAKEIIIDKIYFSTAGYVLHYYENNEEKWTI